MNAHYQYSKYVNILLEFKLFTLLLYLIVSAVYIYIYIYIYILVSADTIYVVQFVYNNYVNGNV